MSKRLWMLTGAAVLAMAALGGRSAPALAQGSVAVPAGETRLALVIGNEDYPASVGKLGLPHEDAAAVAGGLRQVGFRIVAPGRDGVVLDADKDSMQAALRHFRREVEAAARRGERVIAFVYYSGHGAATSVLEEDCANPLQGCVERSVFRNYLMPAREDIQSSGDLVADAVQLENDVVKPLLATGAAATFVVVDACRNELQRAFSLSNVKGFTQFAETPGLLIAQATSAGATAPDDGLVAQTLARALPRMGEDAGDLIEAAMGEVARQRGDDRLPQVANRLNGDVCFNGCPDDPWVIETKDWERAQTVGTASAFSFFLDVHPSGRFAAEARTQLARLAPPLAPTQPGPGPAPTPAPVVAAGPRWGVSPLDGAPVIDGALVSASSPAGTVFKDCAGCPEMIVVPAGRFTLGSPAGEADRQEDEDDTAGAGGRPVPITIPSAFAVARTEVTRAQYAAFDAATNRSDGESCFAQSAPGKGGWDSQPGKSWRDPSFPQADDHPVVCVDARDAEAFAAWTGVEAGGRGYRLLTEAEFEYVNRAGTTSMYATGGADPAGLCTIGNVADATAKAQFSSFTTANCTDGYVYTAPVGRFAKNAFGLYDVTGNVWEWTQDCYVDSYAGRPANAAAVTTDDCSLRVLRGGSWYFVPQFLRSAFRYGYTPSIRYVYVGFRLARTL